MKRGGIDPQILAAVRQVMAEAGMLPTPKGKEDAPKQTECQRCRREVDFPLASALARLVQDEVIYLVDALDADERRAETVLSSLDHAAHLFEQLQATVAILRRPS